MSTFNAGAIEANLTLGRSSWLKDLRKTKKEIDDLERRAINVPLDLDTDNFYVSLDNAELMLDDLDGKQYEPILDARTRDLNAKLDQLDRKLDLLDDRRVIFQVFANDDNAQVTLDNLDRTLDALDREPTRIDIDMNATDALTGLTLLDQRLDRLDMRVVTFMVDADTTNAMIQLILLEDQMDRLEGDPVNIRADADTADAQQDLINLLLTMQQVDRDDINIGVDVDGYATSNAQLLTLYRQMKLMDGDTINIPVDVDRGPLDYLVGAGGGGGGGGGALGLLRILLYAIVILSPVLAAATGVISAGIVGMAAAISGAVGPVAVLAGGLIGLQKRFDDTDPSDYTPAMRDYAESIDLVKAANDRFLDGIADQGYNLMGGALELYATILPTLIPLFNTTADAINGVLDSIRGFVGSPQYEEMLDFFGGFGVDMLVSFLEIGGNLLVFFGELFAAIEPFAREMVGGLAEVVAGWREWAENLDENASFQEFMDNALENGPKILDMLGSMIGGFINLGEALLPFAGPMIEGITFLFDLLANVDPDVLTVLIAGFAGLWGGFKFGVPLVGALVQMWPLLVSAFTVIASPLGIVVGLVAGLAFAIKKVWDENEGFRETVIDTWEQIQDTVVPIIQDIKAWIETEWAAIEDDVERIWGRIEGIIVSAMNIIAIITGESLEDIDSSWARFGGGILATASYIIDAVVNIIEGGLTLLEGIFLTIEGLMTGDWDLFWDGIQGIASGALQLLIGAVQSFLAPAVAVFEMLGFDVAKHWGEMWTTLRKAWADFRTDIGNKWESFQGWAAGWAVKPKEMWNAIPGAWGDMRTNVTGKWNDFKGWAAGWAVRPVEIWDMIASKWADMRSDIAGRWDAFKNWVSGWKVSGANLWDGIVSAFKSAINSIISLWNGISWTINIPDAIPGLPSSFTVSTPNVAYMASGAYVTEPTLAMVGEGREPELVAPESKMREIVAASSPSIDYGKMATMIAQALATVMARFPGVTRDDIERLIESAGLQVDIDARGDGANELAEKLGFQLRVLGYGGANA